MDKYDVGGSGSGGESCGVGCGEMRK